MKVEQLPLDVQYRIGMGIIKATDKEMISFRNRFQQRLNYLKQVRLIEMSNQIFALFKDGKGDQRGINFLLNQKPSANFFCNMSLKDLGIDKRQIIAACCVK